MKQAMIKSFERDTQFMNVLVATEATIDISVSVNNSNSIAWIMGHLIHSRGRVISALGGEYSELPFEERCVRGAERDESFSLDISSALSLFAERGDTIVDLIHSATGDELSASIGRTMPDGSDDLCGYLSFMAWHEAFHLGQIDLIKVANDFDGIK